jgi:spermidine synthase
VSDAPAPPPTPPALVVVEDASSSTRVVQRRPGMFGDVLVVEEDGLRLLRFGSVDAADQSAIDPGAPDKILFDYIRLTTIGPALRTDGRPFRRALALGVGGGAWPRLLLTTQPRVVVEAVEIDPVVVEVARAHFALPDSPRLKVIVDDAARYVERPDVMTSRYDVILLDAFSGDSMPAALSTPQFFLALKRILTDDGVLMVNVALVSQQDADAIVARIAAAFPGCSQVRARLEENQVVFAGKRPLPPEAIQRAIARASVDVGFDVGRDVAAVEACPIQGSTHPLDVPR